MLYAQLRAFQAVANERGFTRAASVLHITQPAVSAQVKALEKTYGVALFERRGRNIALTEPGQRLFEIARRIFRLEEEAHQMLRSLHELPPHQFRVGSDAPYSVSRLIAAYGQLNPDARISLFMGTAEDIQRQILNCHLDVAILVRVSEESGLLSIPFCKHRIVIIVGRDHPLAGRSGIYLKDLHKQPMVFRKGSNSLTSQVFQRALVRANVHPQWTMEVDNRENLREAVAVGVGIGATVEPDAASDLRVKALTLLDSDISIDDYVVCLRHRSDLRGIRAFLALARRLRRSGAIRPAVPAGVSAVK